MPGFCAIAILAFSLLLTQASFGGDAGVRSRESFNASWRFARFGPLAGRSIRPEPGAERWSIVASASSEEASKGNVAENAFDGDQERAGVPRVGVLTSGLCSTWGAIGRSVGLSWAGSSPI